MSESAKIATKALKAKRENSVSQVKKPDISQSLNSPVDNILHLQRAIGNQAVQRLLKSRAIHAKLRIGQPGDKYEQEANRIADKVMLMPEPGCPECKEEEKETIQTKAVADQITPLVLRQVEEEEEELRAKEFPSQTSEVSSNLEARINAMRSGGQPLPASTRAFFEPRFGCDFSQVRVHMDAQAAESARSLNARAFTVGRDIVFGAGKYKSETAEGKQLLAHELTHVIQQEEGSSKNRGNTKALRVSKSPISVQRSPACNELGHIWGQMEPQQASGIHLTVTLLELRDRGGQCIPFSRRSLSGPCPDCPGSPISVRTDTRTRYDICYYSDGAPSDGTCVLRFERGGRVRTANPQIGGPSSFRGRCGRPPHHLCQENYRYPF